MAAGVASIATDCPHGPREIVHDGIDGLLVLCGDHEALANALVHLMKSRDERMRLGAAGRNSVARFSPDSVLAQWNAVIASVRAER